MECHNTIVPPILSAQRKRKLLRTETTKLSLVVRKPVVCILENKDADQLRGNREADQRLCFHYIDSTNALLPKYEISSP